MVASASSTERPSTVRWNMVPSCRVAPSQRAAASSRPVANRPRMKISCAEGSDSLTWLTRASLLTKLAMASDMAAMPWRLAANGSVGMGPATVSAPLEGTCVAGGGIALAAYWIAAPATPKGTA